jgi:hypothetical protein
MLVLQAPENNEIVTFYIIAAMQSWNIFLNIEVS